MLDNKQKPETSTQPKFTYSPKIYKKDMANNTTTTRSTFREEVTTKRGNKYRNGGNHSENWERFF